MRETESRSHPWTCTEGRYEADERPAEASCCPLPSSGCFGGGLVNNPPCALPPGTPRSPPAEHQRLCHCHSVADALDLLSIVVACREPGRTLHERRLADWKAKPCSGAQPGAGRGYPEPYHPTLHLRPLHPEPRCSTPSQRRFFCSAGPTLRAFGEIASGFWQATCIFS